MNIIVLEDTLQQQERIKKAITLIKTITIDNIFITSRPTDIIEEVKQRLEGNVYLLDLEINGDERAGFKTAQEIRTLDPFGIIIFVTTHSNMAPITFEYQVSALDFIAKDLDEVDFNKRIESNLLLAQQQLSKLTSDYDYYIFENKFSKFKILFNDILYFETTDVPHKIRMIGINKTIDFYAELKEVEDSDARFFRSHRSFVVNLANIQEIDKSTKEIIFSNGETCLISRRLLKEALIQLNKLKTI